MLLPFLDRQSEMGRLRQALGGSDGSFTCLYGRRRLGKSRLLREVLGGRAAAVYYVGDERDAPLQRAALAREIAEVLPGFADVAYTEWQPLLDRLWREAPTGAVLVLDELPALVRSSPALPSLLQKRLDEPGGRNLHLAVCGSSQRMMHGLVLDARAPLYGRADQILKIEPLEAGWLAEALDLDRPEQAVEHYAAWGGVPRYWELARRHRSRRDAVRQLVLDSLGVLHREPERLILDEVHEVARTASVLALIGQGCHRLSEIAARLGLPATSLSRPLAQLVDLGLVRRDIPFSRNARDTKRTLYRLDDPFLRFFFRFVEPNRSRLAAGAIDAVAQRIEQAWPQHLASVWEDLVRRSVPRSTIAGRRWGPASAWWGRGEGGQLVEIDVVAEADDDPSQVLVGEVKLRATARELPRLMAEVRRRAAACPPLRGCHVTVVLWLLQSPGRPRPEVITATDVVGVLR